MKTLLALVLVMILGGEVSAEEITWKNMVAFCKNKDNKIKNNYGQTAKDKCWVKYRFKDLLGKVYFCSDINAVGFIPEDDTENYKFTNYVKSNFKLQFREHDSEEAIIGLWMVMDGRTAFSGWCERDLFMDWPISCISKPDRIWNFNPENGKYTYSWNSGFSSTVKRMGVMQNKAVLAIGQCDVFK